MAVSRERRPPVPLDQSALERLALRYVERFATTRAKLARYLGDKLRQRGWTGTAAPDPAGIAERFAALGYVDDRAFAVAKAGAMTRRGLGAVRVRAALRQAGIALDDATSVEPALAEERVQSALALARRKRIGPFAAEPVDRPQRERQIAILVRSGHSFALAKTIVMMTPEDDVEQALATFG